MHTEPMATQTVTLDEAMKMVAEAFNEPAESLLPDRARDTIDGWDSMGALMLMSEIDERFGVELTADESRAMSKVADVVAFLRRHQLIRD